MVVVEEILWNIFTFYSLNGSPKDPSKLHSTALVKFCKDIRAMEQTMTEKPLTLADLHLIYTAACKQTESKRTAQTTEKFDKLDFESFLSSLIRIAQKCYPSNRTEEEAMQQLLMDNILPMASRRKPVSIELLLRQPHIESIFRYYEEALRELYKFYTVSSALSNKGKALQRSLKKSSTGTFDDVHRDAFEESRPKPRDESSDHKMSYSDFMRFAHDFGLVTTLSITTMDLGDIYLAVTFFRNFTPRVRKIDFREFWEAIVRCALVAFQDKKSLTSEIKIKGWFLSIWRHIQSSAADHMSGYGTLQGGGFNTYKGALLRGTQLLNEKFVAAWTKDNYSDYLAPLVAPSPATSPVKKSGLAASLTASAPLGGADLLGGSSGLQTEGKAPSAISKILRSQDATRSERGDSFHQRSSSLSMSQGGGASGRARSLTSEMSMGSPGLARQPSADALMEDKLLKIGVDNIAFCDNFIVPIPLPALLTAEQRATFPHQGYMRVKLSDYDEFDDPRLTVPALRQLFHQKPHIAELMYDALAEANLVSDQRVLGTEGGSAVMAGEDDYGAPSVHSRSRLSSRMPDDNSSDEAPAVIATERPFSSSFIQNGGDLTATTDDYDDEDGRALRVEDLDDEFR